MSTDIQCSLKRKDEEVPEAGQGPSKKIKSKMTCNQTAVAVLQELCMKRKWSPPKYEVHDVTGPSNEPIFDVSVTLCNGIKGIGRGRQKRSAKHDAAQKALDQIQLRALPDADGSDISKTPVKQQGINPHEDIGGMNPVGELQYLCQQKHFPPPEYTVIGDEGEPHEKLFTYRCTVMQRNTTGTARKKQNSKHIAAKNMLDLLKSNWKPILDEIPDDPAVSSTFFQKGKDSSCLTELEKKKDFEHAQRFKMLKDLQDDIPSMPTISPGSQFSHYHIAYAAQLKQYNSVLEDPVFKEETNSFNKLKIICEKINFQISLTTDRGKNDTYIVFLQVNTDPPIIQAGHAEKLDMAIDQAATNTLEFLSIMAN